MPILKDIAAIAKGMSITFMEMFQPTQVENYPDGPGPLRGAMFQERFRGVHVLERDEKRFEKAGPVSWAPRPVHRTSFISRLPRTPRSIESAGRSATLRSITSTTIDVFS